MMNNSRTFEAPAHHQPRAGALLTLLLAILAVFRVALPAQAANGPTVPRTDVEVHLRSQAGYWAKGAKNPDYSTTVWIPTLKFHLAGPVPGGSQMSVEFTRADGSVWLRGNCNTEELPAGEISTIYFSSENDPGIEKKYTPGVGVFGFKIRNKNELTGQNQVLFAGKFQVGRKSKSMGTGKGKNRGEFYVIHDWTLPIGYLALYNPYESSVAPKLCAWIWIKGQPFSSDLAGYVFYKGKQIASTKDQGVGATVDSQVELNTMNNDPGDPAWREWRFMWGILGSSADLRENSPYFALDKNPGEYTIKVLRSGKLCREMKFTVSADGKIVDNGISAANHLDPQFMTVPVKVLGTTDGVWSKLAWKNAFYGNPLKGFTAP